MFHRLADESRHASVSLMSHGTSTPVQPSPPCDSRPHLIEQSSSRPTVVRDPIVRGSLFAPPIPAHRKSFDRSAAELKSDARAQVFGTPREEPMDTPIVSGEEVRRRRLEEEAKR